ncbi:Origin of replication complex subunit 1A [Vitis vinifera]|uniref:Origin recognition complex subunit 1 n=1 Tax=Vitis vinifera TaxID=29760 RepID=A0A438C5J1_VITVI|nr:Origin of replication complex subunit 1A [Vitis vinifera]
MTETPQKSFHSPRKAHKPSPSTPIIPQTPQTPTPRRSSRQVSSPDPSDLRRKLPVTPDVSEARKRKRPDEGNVVTRARVSRNASLRPKKRVYYKKVVYDGCLKPPLKEVPEGDWICQFCEARKLGKEVVLPNPPKGKKRKRTAREKLLSSDLWAAHIEKKGINLKLECHVVHYKYMEISGWYLLVSGHWYVIPEETAAGRQPHNLRTELYRTNDFADIEMESIIRLCNGMSPKEFTKANNEGDDIFLCEYEYDMHWHSFKCLAEIHNGEEGNEEADNGVDWDYGKDSGSDTEEDMEYEEENVNNLPSGPSPAHAVAANSWKGRIFGLNKIGTKKIPGHVRCHKQTELERAKATLLLATLPKSLPCRTKEMEEITAFIKVAICNDRCLGPCLYIHGVPGTGKTMSVLSVMRNLRSEVDAGSIKPYCFVDINGLKLASTFTGVGWEKALHLLNERFADESKIAKEEIRPCILLINELDLLVTRNQSVLYNILDWPTKPHSKLIVVGRANTMDLPEKLLPRISSRMGIQRLCFGPYNYQQFQEIISSCLKGIDAFERQAIEFASRKVTAISGDACRALEICRRAAELADYHIKKLASPPDSSSEDGTLPLFLASQTGLHFVEKYYPLVPKATVSSLDGSIFLFFPGKALVGMAEVEAAIQAMFQAPHIQVS